jgi:hypothetical protein
MIGFQKRNKTYNNRNETITMSSLSMNNADDATKYYHNNHYPSYPTIWNFTNGQPLLDSLLLLTNETTATSKQSKDGYYYALPMWQSAPAEQANDSRQHLISPKEWNKSSSSLSLPIYNQDSFLLLSQEMIQNLISDTLEYDDEDCQFYEVGRDASRRGNSVYITKIANYESYDNKNDADNPYSKWIQNYMKIEFDEVTIKPFSFIYYPIYVPDVEVTKKSTDDVFESSSSTASKNMNVSTNSTYTNSINDTTYSSAPNTSNVSQQTIKQLLKYRMIGILSGAFTWNEYFQGIFHHKKNHTVNHAISDIHHNQQNHSSLHSAGVTGTKSLEVGGLIVVIENSCREIISYRIVSFLKCLSDEIPKKNQVKTLTIFVVVSFKKIFNLKTHAGWADVFIFGSR